MASSGKRVMEKPGQIDPLLHQQQAALKCPRCESSNTKFCYYNNYSLSQPRHFCKACKRYWTRGGTLRNVPVGGGCRKNKRVKRPTSTSSAIDTIHTSANSPPPPSSNANSEVPHNDIASTSNPINPLFYGLPGNSNLFNSRVSNSSGYDLQPQLNANALGLGFEATADQNGYRNGFSSNNTLLYDSMFGSSSTCTPTTAVMASLLSSTLLQQKFINGGGTGNTFQGLEEVQMEGNNKSETAGLVGSSKQVKLVELGQNNRLEWNTGGNGQINHMEHVGLSDPNLLYWNTTTAAMGGAGANWNHDPQPNIGPNYSVTSLI